MSGNLLFLAIYIHHFQLPVLHDCIPLLGAVDAPGAALLAGLGIRGMADDLTVGQFIDELAFPVEPEGPADRLLSAAGGAAERSQRDRCHPPAPEQTLDPPA